MSYLLEGSFGCAVKGMAMHNTRCCAGGGRARAACAAFGSGFGAGSAYTECQREVCSVPLRECLQLSGAMAQQCMPHVHG